MDKEIISKQLTNLKSSISTELSHIIRQYYYEYCKYPMINYSKRSIEDLHFRINVNKTYFNRSGIPRTLISALSQSKTMQDVYQRYGITVKLSDYEFKEEDLYDELNIYLKLHRSGKQVTNFFESVSVI